AARPIEIVPPLPTRRSSDLERGSRVFMTLQEPESGKMENAAGALQCGIKNIRLRNIAASFEELNARIPHGACKIFDASAGKIVRSEEHTSELQSRVDLVCRL